MSEEVEARKRKSFKKFSYRGVDLKDLMEMPTQDFVQLTHARARRRLMHGLKAKPSRLVKKLNKAKAATEPNEKPAVVKTHLRNMVILPEMIGSVVGVYNGKTFNQVEIRPEMVGHYLGEFSITYRPVAHKRAGAGAANASKFMPLR